MPLARKWKRIILVALCCILALMLYGGYRVYRFVDYEFYEARALSIPSPSGAGWIHLVWDGQLMGRELNLLVSSSTPGKDCRWIAAIASADMPGCKNLYWSRDGMVIFADKVNSPKTVIYAHGYDFSQKKRYAPKELGESDADAITRSAVLEKLAQEHGGVIQLTPEDGEVRLLPMKQLSWSEWRQWRERLRTAKHREAQ